jgi:short-subunit dehydrogenase
MSTALITGASFGIGAAFAQALATRKTDLVLVARSEDKLNQLAQELQQKHDIRVEIIVQDLTASGAATTVFEAVSQKGISIDLLINNAGFGTYGAFSESSLPKQLEMIQLNISSLVDLTYQFLPQMQQRGSGTIINLGSIASFYPLPYMSVYAATKAFVLSFSEALQAENQAKGVRVLAVCPGPTKTNFFDTARFEEFASGSAGNQTAATPESVVRDTLKALEGQASTVVAGGLPNKILVNLPRFFPRYTLVKMIEQQFRPKT